MARPGSRLAGSSGGYPHPAKPGGRDHRSTPTTLTSFRALSRYRWLTATPSICDGYSPRPTNRDTATYVGLTGVHAKSRGSQSGSSNPSYVPSSFTILTVLVSRGCSRSARVYTLALIAASRRSDGWGPDVGIRARNSCSASIRWRERCVDRHVRRSDP
jgi:hypothetical protein